MSSIFSRLACRPVLACFARKMDRSNLIVNYLPSGFSEADLEGMFSPFGPIISVKVRGPRHVNFVFLGCSGQEHGDFDGVRVCEF